MSRTYYLEGRKSVGLGENKWNYWIRFPVFIQPAVPKSAPVQAKSPCPESLQAATDFNWNWIICSKNRIWKNSLLLPSMMVGQLESLTPVWQYYVYQSYRIKKTSPKGSFIFRAP